MRDDGDYYSLTRYDFQADVIRVVPLDQDGTPRYEFAHTFTYEAPVTLTVLHCNPLPPITAGPIERLSYDRTTLHAAVTAPEGRNPDLAPLAYALWQRRHHSAAVEAWAQETVPGRPLRPLDQWWYRLIPAWHLRPTAEWPDKHTPHHVYACAQLAPNEAFRLADPPPYPTGDGTSHREHFFVTARTPTPPPPAGLPTLTTPRSTP